MANRLGLDLDKKFREELEKSPELPASVIQSILDESKKMHSGMN
jgi:hypothetical protein